MASESAFDKRLTDESTMDKVEGLLEHFNLPPKVIDFIRANQRLIQVAIAIIVIAVVVWSLYGSYRERIREEASTALALAMEKDQTGQAEALRMVTEKYGNTSSALWARIELGHLDMKKGAFGDASKKYKEILLDVKISSPLYPLILFAMAQSMEGDKQYLEAFDKYDLLKDFNGYEHISHIGMGRLEEAQGNNDKAIAIYNNFLLSIGDDTSFAQAKSEIDTRIARLKGRQ
jgi:predicted negative regulator of RcsB-dependent stress response